jgi:hypothetical protein
LKRENGKHRRRREGYEDEYKAKREIQRKKMDKNTVTCMSDYRRGWIGNWIY